MFIFDTASIASGQTFLIANYTVDHEKFRVATEPQFVSISISLPNSKLLLQLYDNTPTNGGPLVDSVDDGRGAPFAGSTTPKQAMVRIAFDQPGDQSTSWATATMQSGWDANATQIGTPGSIPSYFLIDKEDVKQTGINTLIEPRNWGSLKGIHFEKQQ